PHYPEALWAPGHLSRSHADVLSCGSCHEPFQGPTPQKCLSCHSNEKFAARSEPDVARFHATILQKAQTCLTCHVEHRGVLAGITIGVLKNPHGEFIFRATGATSCSDCHVMESGEGEKRMSLRSNSRVSHIIEEGEGAHRIGHFAKCLNCHRGGQLEVEDHNDEGHGDD
ncbi:MAG: cytochrome c family protein, partial [Nitrospirota bacterium]|nr:cytochrome c family protein [Nitrospirota bacterium]